MQALFRRLDVNDDAELSFMEFHRIMFKLNFKVTENEVLEVFRLYRYDQGSAVSKKSGGLTLEEFVKAYNTLYHRFSTPNKTKETAPQSISGEQNYVKATRYGFYGVDKDGGRRYIFECYTGTISNIDKLYMFELPDMPDDLNLEDLKINIFDIPLDGRSCKQLDCYTLETLNLLMQKDSHNNLEFNSRIKWWVDISSKFCTASEVEQVGKAFGIPENCQDNYKGGLDYNDLISLGLGEVYNKQMFARKAKVLNFFCDFIYLEKKPMVRRDGWLTQLLPFRMGQYLSSRLSIFQSFSSAPCHTRDNLMATAQTESDALLEGPLQSESSSKSKRAFGGVDQLTHGSVPPPSHQGSMFSDNLFLLSGTDMAKRSPTINHQTIGLHILDQGYGPCALLTFRMADSELSEREPMVKHAHSGIIGRLFRGIWHKLLEVISQQ